MRRGREGRLRRLEGAARAAAHEGDRAGEGRRPRLRCRVLLRDIERQRGTSSSVPSLSRSTATPSSAHAGSREGTSSAGSETRCLASSTMAMAPESTAGKSQSSAEPREEPGLGGAIVSEATSARSPPNRPAMLLTARSSPACRTSPERTSGNGGSSDRELLPSMRLNATSPPCEKSTLMSSTASSGSGSRTAAMSRSPSKAPSRTGGSGAFMYRPKQTASVGLSALDSELPALSANERSGRRSPSKSPTTKLETLPSVGILSSLSLKSEACAPGTPLKNVEIRRVRGAGDDIGRAVAGQVCDHRAGPAPAVRRREPAELDLVGRRRPGLSGASRRRDPRCRSPRRR